MKASAKRRRSKKQIEEEKKQEELRQAEIESKLAQFDAMKQANDGMNVGADTVKQAQAVINELVNNGLVKYDNNGVIVSVHTFDEHQQLKR